MHALIAAGANVDDPDKDGMTPLARAAYIGASEAVEYLLHNFAPGAANRATALDIASQERRRYGTDIGGTAALLEAAHWSD
jgi:ankyrin repeat protein